MIVYAFPALLAIVAYVVYLSGDRRRDVQLVVATSVVVVLVSGLRWGSDADFLDYLGIFEETPSLRHFNPESIQAIYGEPGYLLLNSAFRSLSLDFYVLTLACALLSISVKALVSSKLSRHASLTLALYLCIHFITIEFIQIRWAVASSLLILAFYLQYRRKLWATALCLLGAVGFHYFSVVFLLVGLLLEVRGTKAFAGLVLLLGVSGLVVGPLLSTMGLAAGGEAYILERALRYLSEELSSIGPLSYLKLAAYVGIYAAVRLAGRDAGAPADERARFLSRITFSTLALTLFVSFVPIMHHRAVVIADFFAIIFVVDAIETHAGRHMAPRLVLALVALLVTWFAFDLRNALAAGGVGAYGTWLRLVL
jgi:hypothetical protein